MSKAGIILSLSLMLFVSASAVADDPVTIRLYNDDADDIVLSLYDMNAQPPQAVVANQRINGFAWIPISVTSGAIGKGHVKWFASGPRTQAFTDADIEKCTGWKTTLWCTFL